MQFMPAVVALTLVGTVLPLTEASARWDEPQHRRPPAAEPPASPASSTLAHDSAHEAMEPFGPNWLVAENQPCQLHILADFWRVDVVPDEVTWSGSCMHKQAHGEGRAEWRAAGSSVTQVFVGSLHAGRPHGQGMFAWADGSGYEGEWRYGERHGQGVFTWPDGGRYEGNYANGRPHGYGTWTTAGGERYEGQWRHGCFGERGGTWAWIGASREECGF